MNNAVEVVKQLMHIKGYSMMVAVINVASHYGLPVEDLLGSVIQLA